ncbi:MAG: molecular chaperone HtpG [Lachnospirales bacterium]
MEKGNLSINSENIFPIIKKWLYSDTDIFLRELVSNGCDAIVKLKKLASMGKFELDSNEKLKVIVRLDEKAKTIQIIDNGIGMTANEIKKFITEIAFSGATDFITKYQDQFENGSDIIGHFGLGFYSAFMVAEKVQIDSKSYVADTESAKWICDGGIEYEMDSSDRLNRGTTITLYVSDENKDFLNAWKLKEILAKYCSFMPIEIYFEDASKKDDEQEDKPVNDTNPLWLKKPSECTDEEYKEFYHKVFTDFNDPLFWIHLNMDYPFRLKGILYFPKLKHELESIEGQVKLFNNQVFIADNLKEVIPEFLLLLKGTIDCPDLPLNVSRSFLQNDGYVTKMSKYITKKVADKLNSMFKKSREDYEKYWEDISPFIKYGAMREHDFYEKIKDCLLFKTTDGKYVTLTEYTDKNKDKAENKVFYVSDQQQQAQYIKMFNDEGMDAVVLDTKLDVPYVSFLEAYSGGVKFERIDSAVSEMLKSDTEANIDTEAVENLFKSALGKDDVKIKVENLKSTDVSAMIELSEQARRMQEMSAMYGMDNRTFPNDETLVLNANNNVVKLLLDIKDSKKDESELLCKQIYDLAVMSHKPLSQEAMTEFITRSNKIMELLAEK